MPIKYDNAAIDSAVGNWSQLQMDKAQKKLVLDISDVVAPEIGMELLPCQGFWYMAVKKWQTDHHAPISSMASIPVEERIAAATEVKNNFQEIVSRTLANPDDHTKLSKALDKAFEVYLKKYSRR